MENNIASTTESFEWFHNEDVTNDGVDNFAKEFGIAKVEWL